MTLKLKLTENFLIYPLTFLIPLTVRLIPEVLNPYLLGADTPWYVFRASQLAKNPSSEWRIFYTFLGSFELAGINLESFMKLYPAVNFALITFLLCLYAQRVFANTPLMLLTTSFTLSIFPAFLRMSWDLHRQNFALIFLALMLLADIEKLNRRKFLVISILLVLMSLGHEIVFAIAFAILLYHGLRQALRRDWKSLRVYLTLSLIPVVAFVLAVFAVYGKFPNIISMLFVREYRPFLWGIDYKVSGPVDWWLTTLVISAGFFVPISVLGFFHDRNLTPWLALTLSGYASYLISPAVSFNIPERWLLLSSLPLALYTANLLKKQSLLKALILLSILSLQGLSMIGVFQSPLSIYGGQRYGTMIDILSTPESPEVIKSLHSITAWTIGNVEDGAVIIVPYELGPYTQYLIGPNFTVVAQDNIKVKNFIGIYLNASGIPSIYYIAYDYKPLYPLPYLNEKISLEPVHILHPLIVYEIVSRS